MPLFHVVHGLLTLIRDLSSMGKKRRQRTTRAERAQVDAEVQDALKRGRNGP